VNGDACLRGDLSEAKALHSVALHTTSGSFWCHYEASMISGLTTLQDLLLNGQSSCFLSEYMMNACPKAEPILTYHFNRAN